MAHRLHHPVDHHGVETKTLHRIGLHPVPVPLLEPSSGSLVDGAESGHILLEPLEDPVGAQV
jgi:hypothetical protein